MNNLSVALTGLREVDCGLIHDCIDLAFAPDDNTAFMGIFPFIVCLDSEFILFIFLAFGHTF